MPDLTLPVVVGTGSPSSVPVAGAARGAATLPAGPDDDILLEGERRVPSHLWPWLAAGFALLWLATLVWGLSHRMYWGPAILAGDFTFKQGLSGLGTLPAPEEAFDEGTSRYRLTTASLNAQMPWKALGSAWRYSATVRLQKHHTRLTPQDRFSIGGRYTVRGFDNEASLVAESGVVWRNELNWSPGWALGQSPYLGWDMGRVSGPSAANLPGTTLVGAVLGVRGLLGGFQYDCFWGKPISKPAELKASSSTWGFMLHRGF